MVAEPAAVCCRLLPQLPEPWEPVIVPGLQLGTDFRSADVGIVLAEPSTPPATTHACAPQDIALLVEVVIPATRREDRLVRPVQYAEIGVR